VLNEDRIYPRHGLSVIDMFQFAQFLRSIESGGAGFRCLVKSNRSLAA